MVSRLAHIWGHVGHALWDLPDVELVSFISMLRNAEISSPGRVAGVLAAFRSMAEAELQGRRREVRSD